MDWSQTLNLPKTDFPMRANLAQREPQFLRFWEENDIFKKMLKKIEIIRSLFFMMDHLMQMAIFI